MNCVRQCFAKNISQRCLIHTASFFQSNIKPDEQARVPEEVRIPVPWGHIAGKWWGPQNAEPILALHGWQDNANTWDPLAEILPPNLPFLCLDLPGNGRSSHLPPFQSYVYTDGIGLIKRVKDYFGIAQLKLIGHSMGSAWCFMYAGVFPDEVHSYFGVDVISHSYRDEDERASAIGKEIDRTINLALRDNSQSRTYAWEEAKNIYIYATENSLDERTCEILMKRGLIKVSDGKYIFSRDHRTKALNIFVFEPEQVKKIAENIKCHVHIVRGLQSHFMETCFNSYSDLIEVIKRNAKSFEYTELDGKHHLHMDMPELFVEPLLAIINK